MTPFAIWIANQLIPLIDDLDSSSKGKAYRIKKLLTSRREEIIENQYNEIKKLESKYKKLYEGSPVMCRTINKDGIIIDCNQAYLDHLGYSSKDEVIGHSIFEHTPPEGINVKRESFEQWRKTGIVKNKEVWLKKKDGTKFPALINANNLYDDEGNLISSNTVIADLTENHRTRRLLERANEELKIAQQMKDEFIRIAAHELRSPIQPIMLCAELAKKGPNKQEEVLDIVISESRRLKKLADDILDVTRIESGSLTYDLQKSKINEIILEMANSARLVADQTNNGDKPSVTVDVKLDKDVELFLDKGRIAQALSNILNNCLKFTKEGRIAIETTILAHKKLFEIKISDTGVGIAPDILPKLFEKFVTKTSGDTANKHGTGLGLFITKSIVQAHGGDVFAYNNEDGKGANFVLRLPISTSNTSEG